VSLESVFWLRISCGDINCHLEHIYTDMAIQRIDGE